jgi:hypothetical protein
MTEQVLDRQQKHRLAVLRHVEEISGNVAATCRYYGLVCHASKASRKLPPWTPSAGSHRRKG